MAKVTSSEDDDEEEDDDEDDDDDDEVFGRGSGGHDHGHEDHITDTDERSSNKKQRKGTFHSPLIQQLDTELVNMLQDVRKSPFEKYGNNPFL